MLIGFIVYWVDKKCGFAFVSLMAYMVDELLDLWVIGSLLFMNFWDYGFLG